MTSDPGLSVHAQEVWLWELARELQALLDVIAVRKFGVPWQPELALGAVGEDHVRVLNGDVIQQASVDPAEVQALSDREWSEVERRAREYRAVRPRVSLVGRIAVETPSGFLAVGAHYQEFRPTKRRCSASPSAPRGHHLSR